MTTARSRAASLAGAFLLSAATLAGCASDGDATSSSGTVAARTESAAGRTPGFDRGGFVTFERDGRLWVFDRDGEGLEQFLATGEPAKNIAFVGAGPEGRTLRSDDRDVLIAYVAAKPGFRVFPDEGRLWIFREGSPAIDDYLEVGEPARSITFIGDGPKGTTLRSDERGTLLAYLATKPGFVAYTDDDERVWVFEEGSEALAEFLAVGEPAKSVTWIGEGPRGATIRSGDRDTLVKHRATVPGFRVYMGEDGRLWVFREGDAAISEYETTGDIGKNYSLIGEGPGGRTVRSVDAATVEAYLTAVDDG